MSTDGQRTAATRNTIVVLLNDFIAQLEMENKRRAAAEAVILPVPRLTADTTLKEIAEIFLNFQLSPRLMSQDYIDRLINDAYENGKSGR